MESKASLNPVAKAVTSVVVIACLFLTYQSVKTPVFSQGDFLLILMYASILLLFGGTYVAYYLFAPQSYKVDNMHLTIVRPANEKKIKLSDIEEVWKVDDLEMLDAIRNSGMHEHFGKKHRSSRIRRMRFFPANKQNMLIIYTNQREKIIIAPRDSKVIDNLEEKLLSK